jgi:hypothetical protein
VRYVVLLLSCPTLPSLGVSEALGGRRVDVFVNTIPSHNRAPTNCEAQSVQIADFSGATRINM